MLYNYNKKFSSNRKNLTEYSANIIADLVTRVMPEKITSVLDVGCGTGTWLKVFSEKGANNILGIDGAWTRAEYLEISADNFIEHDLCMELDLGRKFSLAISLEVGEHLPEKNADNLVNILTNHSDYILFSAAAPYQGGPGHINEQWIGFWAKKFHSKGFLAYDVVRSEIWDMKEVPFWYKQNIIFFSCDDTFEKMYDSCTPRALVHPDLYLSKCNVRWAIRVLKRGFLKLMPLSKLYGMFK